MRELDILNDQKIDIITKAKFEQRQNKIATISSDRTWYTGGDFLLEWKRFLEIFSWIHYKTEQRYFSPESDNQIIEELRNLFMSAKEYIGIYDNYFDKKILKLIWTNLNPLKITLLSSKWLQGILGDINSFTTIYDEKVIKVRKTNIAHDRFYIIDNSVYSIGISLQHTHKATFFSKLNEDEWVKLITDYKNWWDSSELVIE